MDHEIIRADAVVSGMHITFVGGGGEFFEVLSSQQPRGKAVLEVKLRDPKTGRVFTERCRPERPIIRHVRS